MPPAWRMVRVCPESPSFALLDRLDPGQPEKYRGSGRHRSRCPLTRLHLNGPASGCKMSRHRPQAPSLHGLDSLLGLPAHPRTGTGGHRPQPDSVHGHRHDLLVVDRRDPGRGPDAGPSVAHLPQTPPRALRARNRGAVPARVVGPGVLQPAQAAAGAGAGGAAGRDGRPVSDGHRGGDRRHGVARAYRSRRHVALDGVGVSRQREVAGPGGPRGASRIPRDAARQERPGGAVALLVVSVHGGRLRH